MGIKEEGEKYWANDANMIIPPPTLATEVIKEVTKEIAEKIIRISISCIKKLFYYLTYHQFL